ncbi:hypothetical protein E2C01_095105 [Portunus trituberculatus]|uniref:Uncharacterized protein n=1 Tax=Portunus trituberculatus TaxID=210409 RepID=A0A5B7K2W1_PORTR|nr:hypothetical protein [Portunus trituberculatus]
MKVAGHSIAEDLCIAVTLLGTGNTAPLCCVYRHALETQRAQLIMPYLSVRGCHEVSPGLVKHRWRAW